MYYGQITLEQQIAYLEELVDSYEEGTQARIEAEKELYDANKSLRDRNIDEINRVNDAIMEALRNRYEEQRLAEDKKIQDSIDAWSKWGDAQKAAIQKQIDALDDLTKSEDDAEVEAEKRRKIAQLKQAIEYETDVYNRKKLQEELANAEGDLSDWLTRKERDALKESLQDQSDAVDETVKTEQDKLQDKMDANDAFYDELEKESKLQVEAQKILMNSSQKEILALLKSYAPDYNLTGETLGEQLVDGFTKKVGDIGAWFDGITSKFTTFQDQVASVAAAAADQYYSSQSGSTPSKQEAAGSSTTKTTTINLYFTETTTSPTELRREIERLSEQLEDM